MKAENSEKDISGRSSKPRWSPARLVRRTDLPEDAARPGTALQPVNREAHLMPPTWPSSPSGNNLPWRPNGLASGTISPGDRSLALDTYRTRISDLDDAAAIAVVHPFARRTPSPIGKAELAVRGAAHGALAGTTDAVGKARLVIRDRQIRAQHPDTPMVALERWGTINEANIKDALPHWTPAKLAKVGTPLVVSSAIVESAYSTIIGGVEGSLEMGAGILLSAKAPRFAQEHPVFMATLFKSGASTDLLELMSRFQHDVPGGPFILDPRVTGGAVLLGGVASLARAGQNKWRERGIGKLSIQANDNTTNLIRHWYLMGDPMTRQPGVLERQKVDAMNGVLGTMGEYFDTRRRYNKEGYDGLNLWQSWRLYRRILTSHTAYRAAESRYRTVTHEMEVRGQPKQLQ